MIRATVKPQNRAAFSLVEILVTLVILLVGVLAILRLFPGGFLTIQRTGEITGATAMAKLQLDSQVEQQTQSESFVGVLPNVNGEPSFVNDSLLQPRPDVLTDYTALEISQMAGVPEGAVGDPALYSNVNRLRGVLAETFRIPTLTPNAITGGFGAAYLLRQGPVFNRFGVDAFGADKDSLRVYGAPLDRTVQSSVPNQDRPTGTPILVHEGQYAIDYDKMVIAVYPRVGGTNRIFNLKINYYAQAAGEVRLFTAFIEINALAAAPGTIDPIWQPIVITTIPTGYTLLGLRRDSDELSRKFRLVTRDPVSASQVAPTWSGDPYEYVWYSKQYGDANAGALLFNPIGRTATLPSSTGPRPFIARIDYIIYDNHILRDDRQVPNAAPYDVKLSIPQVLTYGDRLEDQSVYAGVIKGLVAAQPQDNPSLIIYNTATGEDIRSIAGRCLGTAGQPFTLEPRTGTIRLNPTLVEDPRSGLRNATLRFFYRTQKDHAIQMQKAHAHYSEAVDGNTLAYNDFYINYGAAVGLDASHRIYFPRSEAGKSVILGEYYVATNLTSQIGDVVPAVAANGSIVYCRRIGQETYQISQDVDAQANNLCYIDISDQHKSEVINEGWKLTNIVAGSGAVNVQGASLKSRVLWRDSVKQTTDNVTGAIRFIPIWRKYDSDTVLLPKPIQ